MREVMEEDDSTIALAKLERIKAIMREGRDDWIEQMDEVFNASGWQIYHVIARQTGRLQHQVDHR